MNRKQKDFVKRVTWIGGFVAVLLVFEWPICEIVAIFLFLGLWSGSYKLADRYDHVIDNAPKWIFYTVVTFMYFGVPIVSAIIADKFSQIACSSVLP